MAHAFISYVRENADQVDRLVLDLYRHGVDTWTDQRILPGQRWETAIRGAIRGGVAFLACFSPEAVSRTRSYMYEEITVAIEALREMPQDRNWFLPVLLSECEVPAHDIGAGQTLSAIQWVAMFPDWDAGLTGIVKAIRQALRYEQPLSPRSTEPRLPPLRTAPSAEAVDAWRSVWSALFALKIAGEALFTRIDQDNMAEYATRLGEAIDRVGKCAFFFDKDDFQQLNNLLMGALAFRAGKVSILDALDAFHDRKPYGWEYIGDRIRSNLSEFEVFSRLLAEMRDRYAVRTASSTQHLSARRDQRSEEKIKSLEEAAARSKREVPIERAAELREVAIRRAAELMVRTGEISLDSECPRGHGKLREWDGMPRCWSCGWPWKDLKAVTTYVDHLRRPRDWRR
jgi:hypothetical protein